MSSTYLEPKRLICPRPSYRLWPGIQDLLDGGGQTQLVYGGRGHTSPCTCSDVHSGHSFGRECLAASPCLMAED